MPSPRTGLGRRRHRPAGTSPENTDTFLTALLSELGYEDVIVRYETPTDTTS